MSKCDISIRFDREDRTFVGGEPMTGRVIITVNSDVTSNGITLTHHWKTHGKGNAGSGPKETIELAAAGPLVAGEKLDLPFSLTAATHPVTYHGHLINIDHYVTVEIHIPWATNPKAEEDYILLAGEPPPQFIGSRSAVISLAPQPKKAGPVAIVIGCILLVLFMIPLAMFAICLVPIGLIVIGIVWMIGKAVTGRLGEVQLSIPHVIVAPEEDWNLRIRFQPRKQFHINGIYLTLSCKESAKSGSGTQSTTHTHTVYEQKTVIRPAGILEAGVPIDESFSLKFPATSAFSFEETDNKVNWSAEVRIDIPRFPDWKTNQPLQVVPIEFLKQLDGAALVEPDLEMRQPKTRDESVSNSLVSQEPPRSLYSGIPSRGYTELLTNGRSEVPQAISLPRDPDSLTDSTSVSQELSPEISDPVDLGDLVARLAAVSRHGPGRTDIVASVFGTVFDATVIVDRINSSMGVTTVQPGYEDGKTVVGTIQGTDQSIQVMTPKSLNDDIDDLRRGDVWQTQITINGWDSLYNRINACG